jgi:queuine tRNA-ribosyltransferase
MGVGTPDQILEAVKRGIDMFDCVMPTRNARHGTLFVRTGKKMINGNLESVAYEKMNMRAERFAHDTEVLDPWCSCFTCTSGFSRGYLRHLFVIQDPTAARLATLHNITFYLTLMKEIRDFLASA